MSHRVALPPFSENSSNRLANSISLSHLVSKVIYSALYVVYVLCFISEKGRSMPVRSSALIEDAPVRKSEPFFQLGFSLLLAGLFISAFMTDSLFLNMLEHQYDLGTVAVSIGFLALTILLVTRIFKSVRKHYPATAGAKLMLIGFGLSGGSIGAGLSRHWHGELHRVWVMPLMVTLVIVFFIYGAILRRRALEDGTGIYDGPGYFDFYPNKRMRKLLPSTMADRFQTVTRRRSLVLAYLLWALTTGILLALFTLENTTSFPFFSGISELVTGIVVFVVIGLSWVLDHGLMMALRSVIALDGKRLDERQRNLIQEANADTRPVTIGLMAALTLLAFTGAPPLTVASAGVVAVFLANHTPLFILAWSLQAEDSLAEEEEQYLTAKGVI